MVITMANRIMDRKIVIKEKEKMIRMVKSLPFALCETDYSCSENFCNPIFHGAF